MDDRPKADFDWSEVDAAVTAWMPDPPANSFTAKEYGKTHDMVRDTATKRLNILVEKGVLGSKIYRHESVSTRYYWLKKDEDNA